MKDLLNLTSNRFGLLFGLRLEMNGRTKWIEQHTKRASRMALAVVQLLFCSNIEYAYGQEWITEDADVRQNKK